MTKRWSIGLSGLLLVALSVSFNCGENPSSVDFLQKAREINRRITLLDSHVDIPLDYATEAVDPGVLNDSLRVDLVKMAQGGVNGVFLAAYVPQDTCNASGYERGRKIAGTRIEAIHRLCETMYPDRIELARSTEDVSRIAGQGKQVAVIGMENGYPIGKDLSMLDHYYGLGVRYITLCHNGHNDICDSANPGPKMCPMMIRALSC
jgi:membrane dipeptidase